MSLWQRIKLILSSNINAVVSKAEEPDKILEQLLVEMRNQYRDGVRSDERSRMRSVCGPSLSRSRPRSTSGKKARLAEVE